MTLNGYHRALSLQHKHKNVERRNWRYAFLHIGKNAGSTIGDFLLALSGQGHRPPVVLGHDWTLQDVARRYPWMKISFVIRDPLDRIVSGFNSRLRQGRPRNQNLWQPDEAIAFSHFRDVDEFLRACISDDEHRLSAARFARHHIQHVRDGYVHHFGSVEALRRHSHRIHCVGLVDDLDPFLTRLLAPTGVDYAAVRSMLKDQHRAALRSSALLEKFSAPELERLRSFFSDEYAIYDELMSMVSR
jgi:hypothetical protein